MPSKLLPNLVCTAILSCFSCLGHASDNISVPDYQRDTLSGDWQGLRSDLYRRGVAVEAGFKLDSFSNFHGGTRRGIRNMSNLDLKLRADLERLSGWTGGTAYLHLLDNRGSGINAQNVGSLMGISNIEVPVGTSRLFHAWVQQSFMDEQWSVLAGLYPIDAEFSVLDSASVFIHPAYGPSADLALTRGPSLFNNSAAGIRLRWQAADRTRYGMLAVLDGIPGDPDQPKGTHVRFAKGDGSFSIAEFGWLPFELGHVFEPSNPGEVLQPAEIKTHEKYEGFSKYAIGTWRYSRKVDDQLAVDINGNPKKRDSHGAYLLAERSLWSLGGDPARQLTGLIRYAWTDGDSTPIRSQVNLGIVIRGLLAARPDDIFGLAWTNARLANKYRKLQQRETSLPLARNEEAVELTYRMPVRAWLAIQPNLQWIRHPGGDTSETNVRIAGIRFDVLF